MDLGDFPTPILDVTALTGAPAGAFIKRDDLSSSIYGGNKVRTLEVLFGAALGDEATHIYSTGAFGSNHAMAAVLHAPRVGLRPGVVLFPQPVSPTALENLEAMLTLRPELVALYHWSQLPLAMHRTGVRHRRAGERAVVMVPGGATPAGAFGYVSAALEVAKQVEDGLLPSPQSLVIGVGSTCTVAGLLVGFHHAARLGMGFAGDAPIIRAVRVTPWPVTSPVRIARLAVKTSQLLAQRAGDPALAIDYGVLRRKLVVDRRYIGWGYGRITRSGVQAIDRFESLDGFALDTTYTGKSAACFLDTARTADGPTLFWATKSSAALPKIDPDPLKAAPAVMRRWMERARHQTSISL